MAALRNMSKYEVLGFNDPKVPQSKHKANLTTLPKDPKIATKEIKKRFRKMQRTWHPDKIKQYANTGDGDAENPAAPKREKWMQGLKTEQIAAQINEAYEKIQDEEARKKYDIEREKQRQYLQEIHMQELLTSLSLYSDPGKLWAGFVLVVLFLTVLPLIVVLQIDGTLSVPWAVALIPVWIVDFAIIVVLLYAFFTFVLVDCGQICCALICGLLTVSVVVFEVFICLHEGGITDENITENYLALLGPLMAAFCFCCIMCTLMMRLQHKEGDGGNAFVYNFPAMWVRFVIWTQAAIVQTVFIALKLNGDFNKSWIITFIPTAVLVGLTVLNHLVFCGFVCCDCIACYRRQKEKQQTKEGGTAQEKEPMKPKTQEQAEKDNAEDVAAQWYCCGACIECICLMATAAFFVLLVLKLDQEAHNKDSFTTLEVASPVLAILFLACCCVAVCSYGIFALQGVVKKGPPAPQQNKDK